ncbi:DExH-box splicing factor binding site-domain-containing protein [Vararia minispora EC-137]|uniref:DExH-box splicing factor binding site-domain-containing protein n=1 Tax=Vararia minispora EC-137 TaxID=1314806 RepID=A0ACB8QC33_9AGAM|nr:DExH-box splicing factor binding site-domain-containing protein [Vararia minispora EC-137]
MAAPKISFTVRRPTPVSRAPSAGTDSDTPPFKVPALPRHVAAAASSAPGSPLRIEDVDKHVDSSEGEDEEQDELVTGFDQFGVQRLHEKKSKPAGPLVIPALKNRDWREVARARRQHSAARYIPESAKAGTGVDGSVGGLGTRDVINAGPQREGLQIRQPHTAVATSAKQTAIEPADEASPREALTEDQLAIRALLSGSDVATPELAPIPLRPTEDDAYQQDVGELPESATLADYERVPVEQFGAALLRGMGWKEGQAASKRGKGPVEPWIPGARPALLGLGAREKEVFDDGSKKKGKGKPDYRFVPAVKKGEVWRSGDAQSERTRDQVYDDGHSREKDRDRERRDRDNERDTKDYDRDHERSSRDLRDRGRDHDYDYDREDRRDRERRREREYNERDRNRSPRRDRERSRRDRDRVHR